MFALRASYITAGIIAVAFLIATVGVADQMTLASSLELADLQARKELGIGACLFAVGAFVIGVIIDAFA